jgi:predicted exporter
VFRRHRAALFGLSLIAGLGLYSALRFEVRSDITHFLPEGRADLDLELARQLAFGELSRTMVLLVVCGGAGGGAVGDGAVGDGGGPDAAAISREFEAELRNEPALAEAFEFLEGGPAAGFERDLWQLYEARRFGFLAPDAAAARERTSAAGLETAAAELVAQLSSPLSTLAARVAPGDPFLILPRLLERLEAVRGSSLALAEGRFVADDGRSAVLFLATRAPSSDNAAQRPVLAGIRAAFERLDARHGGVLELRQSGANRYGQVMEREMRADIQRVTIGSALALSLLFWALFRSPRLFLLALPVLGAGFVAGTAACLASFGSVHALTLAFGAALIGVSVDYAVHFHVHHVVSPDPAGPRATLRTLAPGLVLSAGTTVVAFVALAISSFPGLRELAVFAAVGISAALLATFLFLPSLERAEPRPGAARALAAWLDRVLGPGRSVRLRLPARGLCLLALGLAAGGLPQVRFEDGIAGLNRLDPALLAEDAAVRERVTRFEQRRIAVAVGADEQAALELDDRLGAELRRAREAGQLDGYWSASLFLPSAAQQRAVDAVLRADAELWPRARAALAAHGLVPEAFEPFRAARAAPPPEPLRPADLAGSSLAALLRPLRLELPGRVAFVSFVRGARDPQALGAALEAAGGRWLDVERELSQAYGGYRLRLAELCGVGLGLVLLLVFLRHWVGAARDARGRALAALRATAMACSPALLGAACTLAVFGLAGRPLNLLSLVALLMVVSMGIDYGVLTVEARQRGAREATALGTTALSVAVAALSTCLGFGLLALSEQPALSGIGSVAGLGVLLSFAFVTILRLAMAEPQEQRA